MEQSLVINNISPRKRFSYSPSFMAKPSKPALKTISETSLKCYSTAISAMGLAGIALNKEEEAPKKITKQEFVEILNSKNVPNNKLDEIVTLCVDIDNKISLETVQKILNVIDLTDENDFSDIGQNLACCVENGTKISQIALDTYIDYLNSGVPSGKIANIISECRNGVDGLFSQEALELSKKYLEKEIDAHLTYTTLIFAKDNNKNIKTEVFEPLLELVENVQKYSKDKSFYFSKTILMDARSKDKDSTIRMFKIANKIVKSGANPSTIINYLRDFKGQEDLLEVIVDYSINTKTPMYKLKRHSFQTKKESHQLIYSTMMKQQKPFLSIRLMVDDLPIYEEIDEALAGLNDFLIKNPDFPVEMLRTLVEHTLSKAWRISNGYYATNPELKEYDATSIVYPHVLEEYCITEAEMKALVDLRNKLLNNYELYVNGDVDNEVQAKEQIWELFYEYYYEINELYKTFDKETMDILFRRRMDDVKDYAYSFYRFTDALKVLFKELVQCKSVDGSSFTPTQKIEFLDLLYAYQTCNMSYERIEKMVDENRVDVEALEFDLFKKIMSSCGISECDLERVPKWKLQEWDLKYIHYLFKEVNEAENQSFANIIKWGLFADFKQYIQDTLNVMGLVNYRTKQRFVEQGLDYNKWVNPDKSLEIQFKTMDTNEQQLEQMAKQTEEDIATLLNNQALIPLITKRFPQNMQDGSFKLLPENYSSKSKFEDFLKNLNHQLEDVWARAEKNKGNNPKANAVLMIKDHIGERLLTIANFKEDKGSKSIDWTIKMWDRNPQKDLFQGNYSTCCIGLGRENGVYMPVYLANTAFNMIEMVDNFTGKTVGNALCYFVTDKNGKPAFVLDNVEINNSKIPSKENSLKLRNTLVEYISKLTKDISGRDDVPIYLSPHYNDINCDDLKAKKVLMSFLGDISSPYVYLDMYYDDIPDAISKTDLTNINKAYRLK